MASLTVSGTKAEVVDKLNAMESPATDDPHYADFCHMKQHAIDFVSRVEPGSSVSISGSTGRDGDGKRYTSISLTEG